EIVRDKIIKLKGDRFVMERVRVQNEGGRGLITIGGDHIRLLDITCDRMGVRSGGATPASDSSCFHPGNESNPASHVVMTGNICLGSADDTTQHTCIDPLITNDGLFSDNISVGDNVGMNLTWTDHDLTRVRISNNTFVDRAYGVHIYPLGPHGSPATSTAKTMS